MGEGPRRRPGADAMNEAFMRMCSHAWVDPNDPPMARAPYSPMIGPRRREMKPGTVYRCLNCDAVLLTPRAAAPEEK